jgi:hypothetical protein
MTESSFPGPGKNMLAIGGNGLRVTRTSKEAAI